MFLMFPIMGHSTEYNACTERVRDSRWYDARSCWWVIISNIDYFVPLEHTRIAIYNPDEMTAYQPASYFCKNAKLRIAERLVQDKWEIIWSKTCLCSEWQSLAFDNTCYPNNQVNYINDPTLKAREIEQERIQNESMVRFQQEEQRKLNEAMQKELDVKEDKERLLILEQQKILAEQNTQLSIISLKEELVRVRSEKENPLIIERKIAPKEKRLTLKEKNALRIKALQEKNALRIKALQEKRKSSQ